MPSLPRPIRRLTRTRLWRAVELFSRENMGDAAAALTYYAFLSLFPALLVLFSLLGLLDAGAANEIVGRVRRVAPGPAAEVVDGALKDLRAGGATPLALVSTALALWSASAYVQGFRRAAAQALGKRFDEGPPWRAWPRRFGATVALVLLLALLGFVLTATGSVARTLGDLLGVGDDALRLWALARWPLILTGAVAIVGVLYNFSGVGKIWSLRGTPGAALAVLLVVIGSVGFSLYVSRFASYNRTYGALASVVVFLIWMWIANAALLLGVCFERVAKSAREATAQGAAA